MVNVEHGVLSGQRNGVVVHALIPCHVEVLEAASERPGRFASTSIPKSASVVASPLPPARARKHARKTRTAPAQRAAVVKAVLVHAQPLFSLGLERVLLHLGNISVKGTAIDAREARKLLRLHRPDVIFIDDRIEDVEILIGELRRQQCKVVRLAAGTRRAIGNSSDGVLPQSASACQVAEIVRSLFGDRSSAQPSGALTKRELEVVMQIAEGKSTPQVAKSLYISENTVKTHLSHICEKLKVDNRLQIARWWHASNSSA